MPSHDPKEILRNLIKFMWVSRGYGKYSCASCGTWATIEFDVPPYPRITSEDHSPACPFRQAQEYLTDQHAT